jgi:ABC-type phosphate/phosphonate transport system permease subunit
MTPKTFTHILFLILFLWITACSSKVQINRQTQVSGNIFDKTLAEFHNPKSKHLVVAAHRSAHNGYPEIGAHT